MRRMELHGATTGGKQSPEYRAYREMLRRCSATHRAGYNNYGGRGIRVCARWQKSFSNFLKDVGRRPSAKYSIERENNRRGYSPSNVVWATAREQNRNTRRNRYITLRGQRLSLAAWTEKLGLDYEAVKQRLLLGWTPKLALTVPLKRIGRLTPAVRERIVKLYATGRYTQDELADRFKTDQSNVSRLVNGGRKR